MPNLVSTTITRGLVTISSGTTNPMAVVLDDYKSAAAHLERLIFTPLDSIPGMLGIGSKVPDFLDEPMDEETAEDILEEIEFLFDNYEPRLTLNETTIELRSMDRDKEGVLITLSISPHSNEEIRETISFFRIREIAR